MLMKKREFSWAVKASRRATVRRSLGAALRGRIKRGRVSQRAMQLRREF